MKHDNLVNDIKNGNTSLGIELGSTRIKAILINSKMKTIATGSYEWENELINGIWTYSLDKVWEGISHSYKQLSQDILENYGVELKKIGSIGFSAMMHGYLVFGKENQLLVPFRTWRNSMTEVAEKELTQLFEFNIPQRWSVAHLYQAILNKESHIVNIDFITTLAGYVHWKLTGEKVIGIGDASGIFPINPKEKTYDSKKMSQFNKQVSQELPGFSIESILPSILVAGQQAGKLTKEGAMLLDPTGNLEAGIPLCPPEGDAGTGMVATNSISKRSGNISAGTSAFAMVVLEDELKNVYPELDVVTTPVGHLVAMVHTNNCTSDINAWINLFKEFTEVLGVSITTSDLYTKLFNQALLGSPDNGGLLSYGYYSGENITDIPEGRPLFVRTPDSEFTLGNFMRLHISSAFGAMKIGMDILKKEGIKIDHLIGHGGIFKTPVVGQRILASAMETPITVMETAGEGGAWGMAILASYLDYSTDLELDEYLNEHVFVGDKGVTIEATSEEIDGYNVFIERYKKGLPIERAAVDYLDLGGK